MFASFHRFVRVIGTGSIGAVLLSLSLVCASAAQSENEAIRFSLQIFDEDVAQSRRQMRKYCAIVQELMTAKMLDSAKQEEAVKYLKESQRLWSGVRQKYENNPPAEYRRDAKFKVRLAEISDAMDDMLTHLEVGRAKRSFQACGFACGLFVSMHEENGLVYGLDRLFHVRKVIKTAIAVNKNVGLEGVSKILPDLMHKRDDVFMAPCPWPDDTGKCQGYAAALRNFSTEIDKLALAVTRRDNEEASNILNGLLGLCNTAYGWAL